MAFEDSRLAVRRWFYLQLDPAAREGQGLSALNRLLVGLILVAAAVAVVETEPMLFAEHSDFFRALELLFGAIFLIEYVVRVWMAVEHPQASGHRFPRLRYMLTLPAIIDLLAVLPVLLEIGDGGKPCASVLPGSAHYATRQTGSHDAGLAACKRGRSIEAL